MPLVKNVWVKIQATGAEETKAQLAEVAGLAREISQMDPTIKPKVDKDGLRQLSAMRVELRALSALGDDAGLRDLASRLRAVGTASEDSRVKLGALRLEMQALARMAASDLANAAGGGEEAGGGGPSFLKGIPGIGGTISKSWPLAIGALAAALSVLPFLAQAAAGAIVFGLGGALTAIGVYAATKLPGVQKQFADLTAAATKDFTGIGAPFAGAIEGILKTAQSVLPSIARTFTEAITPIAVPLQAFGQTLIRVFADKQVADSIKAVGLAFAGILRALTPQLAGDAAAVADGITNIARAIAKNPKPIADFISGLLHLIGVFLDVIAWLTNVATANEQHFVPAWNLARNTVISAGHDIEHEIDNLRHWFLAYFDEIGRILSQAGHAAFLLAAAFGTAMAAAARWVTGFEQRVASEVAAVVGWFRGLPGRILAAVAGFGSLLFSAGAALLQGLVHGIESQVGGVISQVVGLGKSIIGSIGHALGIGSPSRITYQHGVWLAQGLAMGMDAGRAQVGASASLMARSAIPGGYGTGTGGVLRLEVIGHGGGMLDQLFISWLRNYVRVAGGGGPQSVQRALGQVWR